MNQPANRKQTVDYGECPDCGHRRAKYTTVIYSAPDSYTIVTIECPSCEYYERMIEPEY